MNNETHHVVRFSVKVGHMEVQVECESRAEAVRLARLKLCNEMPRLYDVIQQMRDDRFTVLPNVKRPA